MSSIDLNHLDPQTQRFLSELAAQRGVAAEQVAIDLLREAAAAAAPDPPQPRPVGHALDRFLGDWNDDDADRFERAAAGCRCVDPELWQ